uniref:Radical SAM/Cys-rich domain protein n=1 Tax=Caldimicrobium thiodismutans TaxID=1653476 RepID=A0A832GPZ0_9BACT
MEVSVLETYKRAAKSLEVRLCCPISYSRPELLKIIPKEILERDYGCGDPTAYVRPGEVVLDLGSGSGKHCFMIAQIVGKEGKVIGVDFNEEMLKLARKYQGYIAEKLGYFNTEFRKAKIQNLRLDLEKVEAYLRANPVRTVEDYLRFQEYVERLEKEDPLIPDGTIDTVVSNCVLNLVKDSDKELLFREIYRVLKPGGRAVISDIVSDEDVPEPLKQDPELWAGCISGALREDLFLESFLKAGFGSVRILKYEQKPWQVIEGIEFRSITIEAIKTDQGPCIDRGHAVIYKGPFQKVEDKEGHIFELGKRVAVCEKTFRNLKRFAKDYFIFIEPAKELSPKPFPHDKPIIYRSPKTTKGGKWEDEASSSCCVPTEPFKPFKEKLKELGVELSKDKIEVIQLNVGHRCNQSCLHCHLSAGLKGSLMEAEVLEACIELIKRNPGLTVDITGGAPELHPQIDYLLEAIAPWAKEIYFRTNLTALSERTELFELFKRYPIKLVASFPSHVAEEVDSIRGNGTFKRSLEMLEQLSLLGFGKTKPLYLAVNPTGPALVPQEEVLKEQFEEFLGKRGISFNGLFVLNNLSIGRFKKYLQRKGLLKAYQDLLYQNFNAKTLDHLMCKKLINISPKGELFDCDFNQALKLRIKEPKNVFALLEMGLESLSGRKIMVGDHCYGCTALFGTSCFGALTEVH